VRNRLYIAMKFEASCTKPYFVLEFKGTQFIIIDSVKMVNQLNGIESFITE